MGLWKLFVLILALGFVLWQVRQFMLGQASRNWRTTKGKVLRSWVDEHVSHDRYGGTHVSYSANVEYSYRIGTQHFDSKHLTYEPTSGLSENSVTQLLDGITEGAEVDVYYDPHNFEHAVLIPGTSGGNIGYLLLSIAVLAFAIWLCFIANIPAVH